MGRFFRNFVFFALSVFLSIVFVLLSLEIALRIFTTPCSTPGFVRTHPERRYELVPNFKGKTVKADLAINSLGIRDHERQVLDNAYRIAIYGDSITYGQGVELDKTFSKLIEKRLSAEYGSRFPVQVFNMGIPSYNTVCEYRYMRDSYSVFRPDMIILEFTADNDTIFIADSTSDVNAIGMVRRVKDFIRNLYSYDFLASRFYRLLQRLDSIKHKDQVQARVASENDYFRDDYEGWIKAKEAFADIKRFCDERRILLVVAIYANSVKLSKDRESDVSFPIVQKVTGELKRLNIDNIILIDDAFRGYAGNEKALWVSAADGHFSELANSLAADLISDYIVKSDLVKK
jgi:hypothetical protein